MYLIIILLAIIIALCIVFKPKFEINLAVDDNHNIYTIYLNYIWFDKDDDKIRDKVKLFTFKRKKKQ